ASRLFFFFQAEDGIRDATVTGVQTCALPISLDGTHGDPVLVHESHPAQTERLAALARPRAHEYDSCTRRVRGPQLAGAAGVVEEIGRASCRERAELARAEGSVGAMRGLCAQR